MRLIPNNPNRHYPGFALVLLAAAALGGGGAAPPQAQAQTQAQAPEPMRAEADAMQKKIDRVAEAFEAERPESAPPLRTTFTEREINSYLGLDGPTFLPPGIAMPRVQLGDDGRVRARAILDLDAVSSSRERSPFDPLAYLSGSVEVIATGTVEGRNGEGLIRYESATVGGVTVPKTVAQELLRFYTATPERPRGFAFDEPFELPAGLRAVSVESGAATVTQ
jgi:hypothetical protein